MSRQGEGMTMQEMTEKISIPCGLENLDQEQLHPKIFEIFSRQAGWRPLQNAACTTFAKEKSKARREKLHGSPTCQRQRIDTGKHSPRQPVSKAPYAPLPYRAIYSGMPKPTRMTTNLMYEVWWLMFHYGHKSWGWPLPQNKGRYNIDVSSIRRQPSIINKG